MYKWIWQSVRLKEQEEVVHLVRYKAPTKNIDMESGMAKLKENERKVPMHCFAQNELEK